jgi:hypothetical protein
MPVFQASDYEDIIYIDVSTDCSLLVQWLVDSVQ